MARDQRNIFLAPQNERDQGAQSAVTHHDDRLVPAQVNLLQDLVRGGDRLGEDRNLIRNGIGHRNQIRVGQRKKLRKRTVASEDSKHGARGTMSPQTGGAKRSSVASDVDLADDAPPTQ